MKIGFFTDTYKPNINGVVRSIDLYKEALEKRGHEVFIFAPSAFFLTKLAADVADRVYQFHSVRSLLVPGYPLAIPFSFRNYYHISKLQLDVIHSHTPFSLGALGAMTGRIENKPVIMTYHTYYSEYIRHYTLKGRIITPKATKRYCSFIANQADLVISPSQKFQTIIEQEGVRKRIVVLPTGVKLQDYDGMKSGYFRRRYFLGNKKILLFVGRLGSEKNVQFLIRMMQELRQLQPDAVLAIVGEGKYKKQLISLTRQLKLHRQVLFTGFLRGKRLQHAYTDADCFVFASRTDTQGLVLLEACASGLPVVMLSDDGLTDAVEDGRNGFIVHQEDPQLFAERVNELLADQDRYNDFSLRSRSVAVESGIDRQAKKLAGLYEEAMRNKKQSGDAAEDVS
ncbi:MAG: glycosyltransferase [Candidatus Kerfeldbacteria bacterium]